MKFSHILILFLLSYNCLAAVEYKKFKNPEQEESYGVLIDELRCLVCQNQTIADSNADLAKDLRRQVYEMLQQGKSEEEIIEFMIQRYGDFVIYNPPFKAKTGLLWLGPIIFLLIGIVLIVVLSKNKRSAQKKDSSIKNKTNREKVKSLLNDNGDQS